MSAIQNQAQELGPDETLVSADGQPQLQDATQDALVAETEEDSKDAIMTDAPAERRSETRERPISTTPIPLPHIPHILHSASGPSPSPAPSGTTPTIPAPASAAPPTTKSATPTPVPATNGATGPSSTPSASGTAPAPNTTNANSASSPMPARTSTPRGGAATNGAEGGAGTTGGGSGSRAASAHPAEQGGAGAGPPVMLPAEAALHGAPVRQYLNSKVTKQLLEGMKMIAKEQPKDPLRVLGEFLIQRSKELEGTG